MGAKIVSPMPAFIFQKIERNVPVTQAEVSFTPPPGADVIGTPRK